MVKVVGRGEQQPKSSAYQSAEPSRSGEGYGLRHRRYYETSWKLFQSGSIEARVWGGEAEAGVLARGRATTTLCSAPEPLSCSLLLPSTSRPRPSFHLPLPPRTCIHHYLPLCRFRIPLIRLSHSATWWGRPASQPPAAFPSASGRHRRQSARAAFGVRKFGGRWIQIMRRPGTLKERVPSFVEQRN